MNKVNKVKVKVNKVNKVNNIKFGLNLGEIVLQKKKQKEEKIQDEDNLIVCEICQEYNIDSMIKYINCKLKGTKNKKIGRYKSNDMAICIHCIQQCEVRKVGDIVGFKYRVKKYHTYKTF